MSLPDFSHTNVTVLSLGPLDQLSHTLNSLPPKLFASQEVNIVSALPTSGLSFSGNVVVEDSFDDFFSVFDALARFVNSSTNEIQLIIRAGSVIPEAFFEHTLSKLSDYSMAVAVTKRQPTFAPENILATPCLPAVIAIQTAVLFHHGGLNPRHQWYAPWAVLCAHHMSQDKQDIALLPAVEMAAHLLIEDPVVYYRHFCTVLDRPEALSLRDNTRDEWAKLSHTLLGAIICEQKEGFVRRLEECLPELLVTATRFE